jgi:hypothetical protein
MTTIFETSSRSQGLTLIAVSLTVGFVMLGARALAGA